MSLISIAQRETFHISFVQFDNKGYEVDLLTPESYIENENCTKHNLLYYFIYSGVKLRKNIAYLPQSGIITVGTFRFWNEF